MNENLKPIPNFYPTLGIIPTDYLNTMTFLEQITWICNYINKEIIPIISKLQSSIDGIPEFEEEVTNKLNSFQEQLNNYIDSLNIVNQEITNILQVISNINNEINNLDIKIDNNKTELLEAINNSYNNLKNYIDANDTLLNNKIENIQIGQIQVYDPTTGLLSPLQIVINNISSQGNVDGLTATEFDSLELTATEFDETEITAKQFDTEGKLILT